MPTGTETSALAYPEGVRGFQARS